MPIQKKIFEAIVFKNYGRQDNRLLQNSPVYPDVWMAYYDAMKNSPNARIDLILTPHKESSAAELFQALFQQFDLISHHQVPCELATNSESVAAQLTLSELLIHVLPLSRWWQYSLWKEGKASEEQRWLRTVVGALLAQEGDTAHFTKAPLDDFDELIVYSNDILHSLHKVESSDNRPLLWSVSCNRKAFLAVERSVPCTKADAGRRLFDTDGSNITWAVMDTGIDATHSAFRKIDLTTKKFYTESMGEADNPKSNYTRVLATYDFNGFRKIISGITQSSGLQIGTHRVISSDKKDQAMNPVEIARNLREIYVSLRDGRMMDWSLIAPLLRVPHNKAQYELPKHNHGTHVAGIIGAGNTPDLCMLPLLGMCPRINLYDFRVLDEKGEGDEFNILAALQFIRWLNQHEGPLIHGINMSMSLFHKVENYACGQTPVCNSVNRLVDEGVVVVTAAGNQGQAVFQSTDGMAAEGFRMLNITDPGNAENAITVGSTHRNQPHTYGVSYFSSKGPTGDGRLKPDLVAPGEKIISTDFLDGTAVMSGTSQAAPHVSGAAALLIGNNRELIGKPRKVKEILCRTATDLGREKYFQGYGMLDVLRAMQSV